jgi:hypothetical protein
MYKKLNILKSFLVSFIISVLSLGIFSYCDAKDFSAQEIVEKSIEHRSYKLISAKKDIIAEGFIVGNNPVQQKFGYFFLKENNHRLRFEMGRTATNMALTNGTGWLKLGTMSSITIDDISRCYLSVVSGAIQPEIFKYKATGDSIFSAGSERTSGIDCHKVVLIDSKGIHNHYYFAKDDFRLIKFSVIKEINLEATLFEVYYEDYTDFDGMKFPVSIESYTGDKVLNLKIEKVNYDSGLSDSDFVRPN